MVFITFEPLAGSYPYQEKLVQVENEIEVGRATMETPSRNNNLFFTSQVLSRHHAILWYDKLKDKVCL